MAFGRGHKYKNTLVEDRERVGKPADWEEQARHAIGERRLAHLALLMQQAVTVSVKCEHRGDLELAFAASWKR